MPLTLISGIGGMSEFTMMVGFHELADGLSDFTHR
jgi:hypothetical protein